MTEHDQLQQVNKATGDIVNFSRETQQTIADSVMTIQDRNLRFAQNTFLSWMELLTHQAESVQHLQQQWGQRTRKQQGALQELMPISMQIYIDFLRAPFSFSRQLVDAAENAMQHEQERAGKAPR
jgi:hypothetical protein